jgi:hypothetical protein
MNTRTPFILCNFVVSMILSTESKHFAGLFAKDFHLQEENL